MTAREHLRADLNGRRAEPGPAELCAWLTDELGLDDARAVIGANVFGRGPAASVDIRLKDGSAMTFERFSDLALPSRLSAYLVTLTGTYRAFKGSDAGEIAATVFKLARHHAEADEDEAAREWGRDYLRDAPTEPVELADQDDRFRAFGLLAGTHPARDGGEDRSSYALAARSIVLVDRETGVRLVRTGWFQTFVKREVGGVSPALLAKQMARVGWRRTGSEGRIKATCSSDGRTLVFSFYVVDADWGETAGDGR